MFFFCLFNSSLMTKISKFKFFFKKITKSGKPNCMPFPLFQAGSFAVRDHLRRCTETVCQELKFILVNFSALYAANREEILNMSSTDITFSIQAMKLMFVSRKMCLIQFCHG